MNWEPHNLFKFEKLSGNRFALKVDPTLPYFEGHFPGFPVLPAVAVLDASIVAVHLLNPNAGALKGVPVAKFTAVIHPGDQLQIEVTPTEKGEWELVWKMGNEKKAELRLLLA